MAFDINKIDEAQPQGRGSREKECGGSHEQAAGAVENEHRHHGGAGFPDVLRNGAEESGVSGLWVDADIDRGDAKSVVACLDESFHAVGELGVEEDALAGLAGKGAKAGWRITDGGSGDHAQDRTATKLQGFFDDSKFGVINDRAAADHQIGAALQNRLHELGDVGTAVLVVTIGINDDVCAVGEGIVNAQAEGGGQAAVTP